MLGVALLFALPFLGLQLAATGYLLEVLSDGLIPWVFGMWGLGALVFLYVVLGGIRAAAFVGVLQALLFATAIVAVGVIAWVELGGFGNFVGLLAKLGASKVGDWGATTDNGYNALFTTPGVVQFVAGYGKEAPVGGVWTTAMVLSTALSLMGLQLAPQFVIVAFSTRDARGFAPQQVWVAAAAVGFGLVFFAVIAGVGALFLGASPAVDHASLAISHDLPALEGGHEAGLIAYYLESLAARAPWFLGLLAVACIAATQATAALYISATGTMFARDFYLHYLDPSATDGDQKLFGRVGVGLTMLFALLGATYAPHAQAEIGALALSAALQLAPLALAVCWLPWITPVAAMSGLITGLVVVLFTDRLGITLADFFEIDIPWGRWPWTVHSAGWGLVFNVAVCLLFSLLSQKRSRRAHRMRFHDYLAEAAAPTPDARVWRPIAWVAALGWFFFAIGPGLLFGRGSVWRAERGPRRVAVRHPLDLGVADHGLGARGAATLAPRLSARPLAPATASDRNRSRGDPAVAVTVAPRGSTSRRRAFPRAPWSAPTSPRGLGPSVQMTAPPSNIAFIARIHNVEGIGTRGPDHAIDQTHYGRGLQTSYGKQWRARRDFDS